ncbi:UNKNOWN [Stylonychia lemnae]|uniref:Uncharacterized protein n=1 Tax=Stylonychia lemnae TaxID=5949 RepID=A0A078AB89_STYLE|nr:UNKNOWN [Stylonychia lemnae]|eukprot:CDW79151.1 UNKNOWN [Stylonychia lemnae]
MLMKWKAKENIPKLKLDLTVIREEDPENNADDINNQSTMRGIMSERTSFEIGFSSRFNNALNQKRKQNWDIGISITIPQKISIQFDKQLRKHFKIQCENQAFEKS